ncbi:hypothetical protein ACFOWE_00410 [Planomonospora corallina]|uniref:Uncharacterized protein n=1 Tax=Planomonospora corallina TaxID=1806052 RepID=A0ABV8HXT1_9ACTN
MPLLLEFFGMTVAVLAQLDLPELAFLFGSHLVEEGEPQLLVKLVSDGSASGEVLVQRPDGMLLQRRLFRGWSTMPPPVPPLAVLDSRFLVVRAVVMARDDVTVALIGSACSPCADVAAALAGRSWRPVAGQFLVVDRDTGHTLPFHTPLDLRGAAIESAVTGGLVGPEPESPWWRTRSTLSGESLLVRPERLGPPVPIAARLAPPTLVRLCQGEDDRCALESWEFQPHAWPPAAAELAEARRYRLLVPELGGAEEAAALIDDELKETSCPGGPRTAPEHRAGLITSPSM